MIASAYDEPERTRVPDVSATAATAYWQRQEAPNIGPIYVSSSTSLFRIFTSQINDSDTMNTVRMVCICTAMWNISQYTVRKWHCCVYSTVSITKEWVLYHKTPAYTPQLAITFPKDELLLLKLVYWRIKIKLPAWMMFLLSNSCHNWCKYVLLAAQLTEHC
jgi:hypothetical protein